MALRYKVVKIKQSLVVFLIIIFSLWNTRYKNYSDSEYEYQNRLCLISVAMFICDSLEEYIQFIGNARFISCFNFISIIL